MGGSSAQKSTPPTVPGYLKPLLGQTVGDYSGFGSLDSLWNEYENMPLQGNAPIPQQGLSDINQLQQVAQGGGLNPYEQQAAGNYESFLGSAGQPSEATQAELNLFQNELGPAQQQQAELMGQGNSGAALAGTARGMEEAMVPFMQSDLQNQLSADTGLANLGQTATSNIEQAMQGQQWKQQTQQQGMTDLFNQLMNREQLATGVLTQPFGLLGSIIGGGTQVNTSPKF